jgi:hypothetical protein
MRRDPSTPVYLSSWTIIERWRASLQLRGPSTRLAPIVRGAVNGLSEYLALTFAANGSRWLPSFGLSTPVGCLFGEGIRPPHVINRPRLPGLAPVFRVGLPSSSPAKLAPPRVSNLRREDVHLSCQVFLQLIDALGGLGLTQALVEHLGLMSLLGERFEI